MIHLGISIYNEGPFFSYVCTLAYGVLRAVSAPTLAPKLSKMDSVIIATAAVYPVHPVKTINYQYLAFSISEKQFITGINSL
jgi:hypothetical protein